MSNEKKATTCSDCGAALTKSHEVVDGMCFMCGPGSAKYQEKNPNYVHGKSPVVAGVAAEVQEEGLRYCRVSGLPLTKSHELELDLHYMHGPGSENWQKLHPDYKHTSEEYQQLVNEYRQEKANKASKELVEKSESEKNKVEKSKSKNKKKAA